MSQYKDATEIPGFGSELILYKRADLTSDAWWYRARIRGRRGYIRRSTRETDVVLAMSHAKQSYFQLMGLQDQGLELGKRKVSELAKRFFTALKDTSVNTGPQKSAQRIKYIEATWFRYMEEYFGSKTATDLDMKFVSGYWHHRMQVNKSDEVKLRKIVNTRRINAKSKSSHNIVETPSYSTLRAEASIINEFMRWCLNERHIGVQLKISATTALSRSEARLASESRRPTFDDREWSKITRNLNSYVDNVGKMKTTRMNAWHKYRRQMFRYYVLFLSGTGLRVGEAKKLTWRKISTRFEEAQGHKVLRVIVDADTSKVRRSRTAIGFSEDTALRMEEWRKISKHSSDDDLVFYSQDVDGVQTHCDFSTNWKAFLTKLDLWKNDKGKTRPIYSLRHYYATQRLKRDTDIYQLALLMGTGVHQVQRHYSHIATESLVAQATKGGNSSNRQEAKDLRETADLIRLYREGIITPEQITERILQIGDTMGKYNKK